MPTDPPSDPQLQNCRSMRLSAKNRRQKILCTAAMLSALCALQSMLILVKPLYYKVPMSTQKGYGLQKVHRWLLHPSPKPMHHQLGISPFVFRLLLIDLQIKSGLVDSRYVMVEEKLAIFLYICRKALTVRHTAEAFQRSPDTVARSVLILMCY